MTTTQQAGVKTIIGALMLVAVLFLSAGTFHWLSGWLYVAVLMPGALLPLWGPFRLDEGLLRERLSSGPGAKDWDRPALPLIAVLTLVELIVPGLDHRWQWSPALPDWVMWAGFVGVLLGTAGLTWAMWTNRFFSAVVRIQRDRGHHVVMTGPYSVVRHPGYAAWVVQAVSMPFLFRSLWTFIPVALLIALMIVRTVLEDRTLLDELDGYRDYATEVRARLVPGIW